MQLSGARCRLVAITAVLIAAALPAAPASAQVSKQLVRLPYPAYDGTLTPYTFGLGYPLVTLVYDTLLWRDEQGTPRPWLARKVERSEDGKRLTLTLRDDARWHDGRPVTAADVAFTFRYAASHYHPRFTPALRNVRRVSTRGRQTVVIDLKRRSLGFDDQPLADLPILPRHLWRNLPPGSVAPRGLPVGSGPYRLVSEDRKDGYVFRANDSYFLDKPTVREIRVPIIGDADKTYKALVQRRLDMVPLIVSEKVSKELDKQLGIGLEKGPSYTGTALVLNTRRAPFDRRSARTAVAASLNLGRLVRNVPSAAPALRGYIHPASRWAGGARVQHYDAAVAATADAELQGKPLRILAPANDPIRLEAARQVVLALQRAGAGATLAKVSRARLDRALGANGGTPDFDAAIDSIPALVSTDPDYLTRLFGSDRDGNAPLNVTGYRSAKFDELARRTGAATTPRLRRIATTAELRQLARDAPAIPLFFSRGVYAQRPAVYSGWVFVKGTGILDKRSFLPGGDSIGDPNVVTPTIDAEPGWVGRLDVISLAILAVVAGLVVVALVRRRREPRR